MKHSQRNYLYCRAFQAFFTSLEEWEEKKCLIGLRMTLDQACYDAILKGTDADVYCPMWASVAVGNDQCLQNAVTLEIIRFYKEWGYSPVGIDSNPYDYLAEQFRFLCMLYACEEAEAARTFEDRYTVQTVQAFNSALRQSLPDSPALALADAMDAYFRCPAELEETPKRLAALEAVWGAVRNPAVPTEPVHMVHSAGANNCGGKCKIDITCAEGCALEISTDNTDNSPQIRACLRGRGYRRTFLDPRHRLRYPMKRVGERGEGKFRRISWEEAAEEIARTVLRCGREYGPGSRYFIYGTGNCSVIRSDRMLKRLLNQDGGYLDYYNSYSTACCTYVAPYIYGDSLGGNSERDVLNSKLIILWGHNPSETIFGSYRNYYLAEAKRKGIPIIVIDPRMSDTALALAEEWIPIRPSTDGAMADAMGYVIVSQGLHDMEFLHKYCVGFDAETLPPGAPAGSDYLSYLMGTADGVAKTPEWAEAITGVPAQTIRDLALRYASCKPAAILPGFGPQRNGNGEQGTRAVSVLACLTANVGISGGSSGVPGFRKNLYEQPVFPIGENPYPGKIPTFLWYRAVDDGTAMNAETDGLKGVERLNSGVKVLFSCASNTLMNQHSNLNRTSQILKDTSKCELIVVYDIFMTSSARYADILLPATSLLESNNITCPWANDDYLLSNSKAVEPLFESRQDFDFGLLVAKYMGMESVLTQVGHTQEECLENIYARQREIAPELPVYARFREQGGYVFREPPLQIAYRENIFEGVPFNTPSGKIELYSQTLADMGQPERIPPIPRYVPAPEGPEDALQQKYPLQLVGYHTKRRCHSIHDTNRWLEEVDPPALWIHPEDAKSRGIGNGDMVEVFNDRGVVRVPAKVTERIMRGVTAMSQGGWYTPDKKGVDTRGCINVLTDDTHPTPLAKGNPQHTNLVEVRLA
ncbi:MAG: molybdopterin-dependent oxidoreductase [Eubacteriales bacterium]|nr:molybdopterin-dependent oxidoreductase [Eubacteriales bacterium]